jgi:hypothetical protein
LEAEVKQFAGLGRNPVALSPGVLPETGGLDQIRVRRRNGRLLFVSGIPSVSGITRDPAGRAYSLLPGAHRR